jgi:arylsulfatase A-like enzyme
MPREPISRLFFRAAFPCILTLCFLLDFNCSPENKYAEGAQPDQEPPSILGPGDPIAGLAEPDKHPSRKIRIGGVVKNAVAVSAGDPVRLSLQGCGVTFAAGVLSEAAPGKVKFAVKDGERLLKEFELDPGSKPDWLEVKLSYPCAASSELSIECDLKSPGAYIAHPAPCSGELAEAARPTVVFLLVDAMRADALGAYGREKNPSPNIDALARQGALFEHAYTSAPFTLTSVASIFTGLFPWQHGLLFSGAAAGLVLSRDVPDLVENFRPAGYVTAAFSGTYFNLSDSGLDRGFDSMDETCAPSFFRDSAQCLTGRVESWLAAHRGVPSFLYIHFVDAHAPYQAPAPFRDRFVLGLPVPRHDDVRAGEVLQFGVNRKWYQYLRKPDANDLAYLRGRYEGEVAYADANIGKLLADLEAGGRKTIVLVTADHGEAFYEHGVMEHVADLHQPVMRVPLILSGPGVPAGVRVSGEARTIDFMPTLLDLAGIAPPEVQGRSLVPLLKNQELPPAPAAAVHFPANKPEYVMVLWPWKIFYLPEQKSMRLYNLDRDPNELQDIAAKEPEALKKMEAVLDQTLSLKRPAPSD